MTDRVETLTASALLGLDGHDGPVRITMSDGVITEVQPTSGPVDPRVVCAGFVDLQVNGFDDVDVSAAEPKELASASESLARTGVTAWLPTVVTRPLDAYERPLAAIAEAMVEHRGAVVLGAHLEGPFIGGRAGAHRRVEIDGVDVDWCAHLPPSVSLVTLGPELDRAEEAIAVLTRSGMVVSVGHTDADAAQTEAAIAAGASMATHVFNAMPPLHHREPGALGIALSDDRLTTGLIADGVHVDRRLLRLVFRAKTAARVALVTDAIGWRSGRLADRGIEIVDGAPRLPDGTLAGSVLTMDEAIRNVVDAGVTLDEAVTSASSTPAAVLGDGRRGRIAPGRRADVVVLDPDSLTIERTIVAGLVVHER